MAEQQPSKLTTMGSIPADRSNIKRGRARIEDRHKTLAATEPWKAAGMSRATWFRRRGEERRVAEAEGEKRERTKI